MIYENQRTREPLRTENENNLFVQEDDVWLLLLMLRCGYVSVCCVYLRSTIFCWSNNVTKLVPHTTYCIPHTIHTIVHTAYRRRAEHTARLHMFGADGA